MLNPLLISLAREYVECIDTIQHGCFAGSHALHDLEGMRGLLHAQLMGVINSADYVEAEQDTYAYALKVVRWSRMH